MSGTTLHGLAVAVRGRRIDLGLSQEGLARQAGVSRKWVYQFEGGKPNVELGLLLRVLDALGLGLEVVESDAQPGEDPPEQPAGVDLDELLDRHRRG